MTEGQFPVCPIQRDGAFLRFLYRTWLGRVLLQILIAPWISKVVGWFLSRRLSLPLAKRFIKKNAISAEEYDLDGFGCFNDCFTRRLQPNMRPIDQDPLSFIAPCDARLRAYRIENGTVLDIKHSAYTVQSLLNEDPIAARYQNGYCLVFRLCVDNYHRYCYLDDATKSENVFIRGKLHTVRPIALQSAPVFVQNCREYTVLSTKHFGTVTQVEVGALLVGKIKNHHGVHECKKGEEKGLFLYGGSTIVVLIEEGKINLPQSILQATNQHCEVLVKMGQAIARAVTEE